MKNVRRNDNRTTYEVKTKKAVYLATVEKLHNDRNGAPRYNVNIITLKIKGEKHTGNGYYTRNFTFTGDYSGEEKQIIDLIENYL